MTIFIIDGTNPIMDAVGDHPTERSITLQNNGLSDITEPFTQVWYKLVKRSHSL